MSAASNVEKMSKKLILCCDGTWDNSVAGEWSGTGLAWLFGGMEEVPTNITKISRAIKNVDSQGRPQIVYYQPGVGSNGNLFTRIVGGAFGVGLAADIRTAYSFLATNYVPGDEIYLIGFSRGSFTARSVGSLICDLGLLNNDGQEYLVDIFTDWENAGSSGYHTSLGKALKDFSVKKSGSDPATYVTEYRKALQDLGFIKGSWPVPIKAIGVFETVGSLGIPVNPILLRLGFPLVLHEYRFYDTNLGTNVENAFQALALDEERSPYYPAIWAKPQDSKSNLKQCWFPGVHENVGGGYKDDGLSTITLAWMMSNLASFIDFDPTFVRKQWEKNQMYLEYKEVPKTGLEWAASQLQNTATGLFLLLGIVPRRPGRYHEVNEKTLVIEEDKPLRHTNEHIHVAVRSRLLTGGLNVKDKVAEYKPKSFKRDEYELIDPKAEPGEASWRYIGNNKEFTGEILPEDELGVFEREIFENYVDGVDGK